MTICDPAGSTISRSRVKHPGGLRLLLARAPEMQVVRFGNGRIALAVERRRSTCMKPGKSSSRTPSVPLRVPVTSVLSQSHWLSIGLMDSIYVRDPDGNLIELSNYPNGS